MNYTQGGGGVTARSGPKLLDQVCDRLRVRHYSLRTEQAYLSWIRRFILASGRRHPAQMEQAEVEAFLTRLATDGQVSAGTQNRALAALLFLYREVLRIELPWKENLVRAKRPRRIPVVLSREEVARLLAVLAGPCWLIGSLLYGSGMRLMEGLRLRIEDVDAARGEIVVRWQGGQAPLGAVAAQPAGGATAATRTRTVSACGGSGCRCRSGLLAARVGAQGSQCRR
ncbi:phage integrase N-terminal SAM-like domain-containing protein [Xanthomonas codiaei]|nr:phage integrase N-terminal SAM-like domain-containing protein [Xanthomonas codiaei]